jgi:hypothetical protein
MSRDIVEHTAHCSSVAVSIQEVAPLRKSVRSSIRPYVARKSGRLNLSRICARWQIIPPQCSHRRRLRLERMCARLYQVQTVSHLSSVVNPEKLNWL